MSANLVSTKPVSLRYQLNWTVKGPREVKSIDLQFPEEIPGHATLKLHLTGGYVGDGWVMSPDIVSGVSFSMTWSAPVDSKLSLVCGLNVGKFGALKDVNLDNEDSYRAKMKFAIMGNKGFDTVKDVNGVMKGKLKGAFQSLAVTHKSLIFSVKAEVLIVPDSVEREYDQTKSTSSFLKEVRTIRMDGGNSDLKIICAGQEFSVHKAIISARCEVFKNAFANETLESSVNVYRMNETSAEACDAMLKFLYTGVPGDISHCHLDLLELANMYLLIELKSACLDSLLDSLRVDNCIETFIAVDKIATKSKIRTEVLKYISCKVNSVIEDKNWDVFIKEYPALATDVVRSLGSEKMTKHACQFCQG